MTDDEREAYRRTLMKLYEKAMLDYGEKRGLWKLVKRNYVADAKWRLDFYNIERSRNESFISVYHALRDAESFGEPNLLGETIINAWGARCKALKLKKELRTYGGQ